MSKFRRSPILDDITRGRYGEVINLKQPRHRLVFTMFALVIMVLFVMVALLFTTGSRANDAVLYPQTCLGNWINPSSAQGETELGLDSNFGEYDGVKAALYNGGQKQIFCGDFKGDIPGQGELVEASLKIIWANTKKWGTLESEPADVVIEQVVEVIDENQVVTSTSTTSPEIVEEKKTETVDEIATQNDDKNNQLDQEESNEDSEENIDSIFEDEEEIVVIESEPATTTSLTEAVNKETNETTEEENEIEIVEDQTIKEDQSEEVVDFVEAFPKEQEVISIYDLFIVKYSLDGNSWQELATITTENWLQEFDLPLIAFEDLGAIQFSIESLPAAEGNLVVLLDGLVLDIKYEELTTVESDIDSQDIDLESAQVIELDSELLEVDKEVWQAQDSPEFELDIPTLSNIDIKSMKPDQSKDDVVPILSNASTTTSTLEVEDENIQNDPAGVEDEGRNGEDAQVNPVSKKNFISQFKTFAKRALIKVGLAQTNSIEVLSSEVLTRGSKKKVNIHPIVENRGGKINFRLPKQGNSFKPGGYMLSTKLLVQGEVVEITREFSWGVLAFNVDKTIYQSGDRAYLQMAVLDNGGHTLCNANLNLDVTDPNGNTIRFSTADESIQKSTTCGPDNVTDQPDYYTFYDTFDQGEYRIRLENTDKNYVIIDSFFVDNETLFDVTRSAATRINPFRVTYQMRLKVNSKQDFKGEIREEVPLNFEISKIQSSLGIDIPTRVDISQGRKYIYWQVDLNATDSFELSYIYKAPEVSPQFYLLGPMQMIGEPGWWQNITNQTGDNIWQEARQWQIAADADAFRVTEYYLTTSNFTGTTYDLTLDQDLADNYFVLVRGSKTGDGGSNPDNDYARVYEVPNGKGELAASGANDVIALSRYVADVDWEGVVTVVESLGATSTAGFNLVDIVETSIGSTVTSGTDTSTAWNASSSVVLFGGFHGGGAEFEAASTATGDGNSVQTRLYPTGTGTINWTRESTEALFAVTLTTFVVEWGSEWTVQHTNVSGSNVGNGCDATAEYNTGTINSVVRDDTWVWATGIATNDGIGDSFSGTLVTLGDGVNQNTNETLVSFCGEYTSTKNADIYTMTHNDLAVDYRKKSDGDQNVLDIAVSVDIATDGYRFGWVTNGCNGSGSAHPRDRMWARYTADSTITISRGYDGQNIPAWVQGIDFSGITYAATGPDTQQVHFRWRDDTTALNTTGGWLALEDANSSSTWSTVDKNSTYRLRMEVANEGASVEAAGRTYELQWGEKTGLSSCSSITTWTGVADSSDAWAMSDSTNIATDGASTTVGLLANTETYSFTQGQGRDVADTTGTIGPMAGSTYSELEYAITPTTEAVTGHTYCFRVYDTTAAAPLAGYQVYPELTLDSVTADILVTDYMEWGREFDVSTTTWSTVEFDNTYTEPIFLCSIQYANNIGTEADGDADSAVCRVNNLGSTSTQVMMQEAVRLSGHGLEQNETVHWMVVEAGNYDNGDIKMEAFATSSTVTAENGNWNNVQAATYSQSYTNRVVLGQVTSYNDAGWSVFFARGSAQADVPDASNFNIGKHVGEDIDLTRNDEDLSVVVIEAAHGSINGIAYDVQQSTGAPIERIDDSPNDTASFYSAFTVAPIIGIVSQSGISGGDGPHQELYSSTPFTASTINSTTMEDEYDGEQSGNTENVGFIVFSSTSTVPVAFDQTTYRWYENVDAVQPTTPMAAENTATTGIDISDVIRLRMSVQVGVYDLSTSTAAFKLQWGEKSTTCGAIGTWNDLGLAASSTAIWRGYGNSSVASSTQITTSLLNSGGNILQSYEEENNSTSTFANISAGERGEWDWVIQNHNASGTTDYCFRMVTDRDDILMYTNYPELTTAAGGSLTTSIVDDLGSPLASPFVPMATTTLAYSCSSSTGMFGTSTQKIRVENTTASAQWTLTMAANSTTDTWNTGSFYYDFNDNGGAPVGCTDSGVDVDAYAGQMTVDPSVATTTPEAGCTNAGLSFGSQASFVEGTTDTITLLTAGASAGTDCYWDLKEIDIEQIIPIEQDPGDYNIDMVITITAT